MITRLTHFFSSRTGAVSSKKSDKNKDSKDTFEERSRQGQKHNGGESQADGDTSVVLETSQLNTIIDYLNQHELYQGKGLTFHKMADEAKIGVQNPKGKFIQYMGHGQLLNLYLDLKSKKETSQKGRLINIKC